MKTIQTTAQITGIRSKADHSLGLTISTPEYSADESAEMLRLQGVNVLLTIKPMDETKTETLVIDRESGQKSPSERMRGCIYRMWESRKDKWPDSDAYYRHIMEGLIDQLKDMI